MGFDSRYRYTAGGRNDPMDESVTLTVREDGAETTIEAPRGAVLRDVLRSHGFDVYGSVSKVANCGGRGLCGTCGVRGAVARCTVAKLVQTYYNSATSGRSSHFN